MFCLVFDVLFVRYSRRSRYTCVLESEPEKNQFIYSIPPISPNRAALLKQYLSFVDPPCIDPSLMTVCTQFFFRNRLCSKYLPSLFQDSFSVALSKVPILFHRYHRLSIESKRRDTFVDFKKMLGTTQHRF